MSKWEAQAEFMRKCGATHATWSDAGELTSLTLAPQPRPVQPPISPTGQQPTKGIAARLARNHETLFAHTRVRPPLKLPNEATSVPRAVAAKHGAADGSTKAQKRTA